MFQTKRVLFLQAICRRSFWLGHDGANPVVAGHDGWRYTPANYCHQFNGGVGPVESLENGAESQQVACGYHGARHFGPLAKPHLKAEKTDATVALRSEGKRADVSTRQDAGKPERSAGLSPERWEEVKALLREVQDVDPGRAESRIQRAFPDDSALCHYVLDLYRQYNRSTQWLGSTISWNRGDNPSPIPTPVPGPGDMCGSYRIKRRLGAGGMGVVFLAEDTSMGNVEVALKTVRGDEQADPIKSRMRMMEEATRQAALRNHPNVAILLHVVECGTDHRQPFLVMEYVEGLPASAHLANGPARPERVLRWATQVASAIDHAHNKGILHCDLKPANIQITTNDDAKVLDFGLARAIHEPEKAVFGGTIPYMAPEQLQGGVFSEASDLYSFGVTLFELLTGRRPFEAEKREDLTVEILGCPPPKASHFVPDLPRKLDEVLERALAKDPIKRFKTARELNDALHQALGTEVHDRSLASRIVGWLSGIAAAGAIVTGLGFLTSKALDLGVGRTNEFSESPLWWPVYGLMSFTAPVVYFGVLFVALYSVSTLFRVALRIGPIKRLFTPIVNPVVRFADWVRGLSPVAMAQILLTMQLGTLLLIAWYFSPLIRALFVFSGLGEGDSLAELRPENIYTHGWLRLSLSLNLFLFGIAWVRLLRRKSKGKADAIPWSGLVAGAGVLAVSLFAFSLPFRPLYHNKFERVSYKTETCYETAHQGEQVLLWCPFRLPRALTVRESDVVKSGEQESIFTPLNSKK